MNTTLKELLGLVKTQPVTAEKSYATASINSNATTELVAATSGKQIRVSGLWVSGRNDHASAVLTVKVQDDSVTPLVFAEVFIGPSSQVNGFINLADIPRYTGSGKKLNCVTATGTANTVRIIVQYDLV